MANPKQIITSLLTEHFKYTPLTLVDDIINLVNELVYRAVTAVEEGLTNTSPMTLGFADKASDEGRVPEKDETGNPVFPEAKVEIENGVHQLETLLESTVDKNFDKLEIYVLRNILTVPEDLAPWIRLGHYENLDFSVKADSPTPESLYTLRRKYQETQKLHNALLSESSRNSQLIKQLKALLQPGTQDASTPNLSFLTNGASAQRTSGDSASSSAQRPITAQTEQAIAQLPALRQLLGTLREKADSIKVQRRADGASEDRREYIEAQARAGLERGGAVDVQTGERLASKGGLGPAVGDEEVRGIEGVASRLEDENDRMED